jgi:hypothetical protein
LAIRTGENNDNLCATIISVPGRDTNLRLAWLCRTRKHHRALTALLEASASTRLAPE